MNKSERADSLSEDLEIARLIHALCLDYEEAFKSGEVPSIDQYLENVSNAERTALLRWMLPLEISLLRHAGQKPEASDYLVRYPEHAQTINKAFSSSNPAETVAYDIVFRIRCPKCAWSSEVVVESRDSSAVCPLCGTQVDAAANETIPVTSQLKQVAHFELVSKLGQGGFGEVWRAWDMKLNRFVALKIQRADLDVDRKLFEREAKIVAQLKHSNIVKVFEYGEYQGRVYMVTELLSGKTLAELLKGKKSFSPREAADLCATVAQAIHHAHELDIVHRDIKPGNILLRDDGIPFVLDFGLAKLVGTQFSIAAGGHPLGTAAYMPPEQAAGDSSQTTRRSDVYSLGVVLYELLAGQPPFRGDLTAIIRQIDKDDPLPPQMLNPKVPADLQSICLKSLEKKPAKRYATAQDFADDLQRFLRDEPVRARPIRWWNRAARRVRKNPVITAISVAAVLAISLFALEYFRNLPVVKTVQVELFKRIEVDHTSPVSKIARADVVFWLLDPLTGRPRFGDEVRASGDSPLTVKLQPGDYFVVVVVPDHGFHEVYRHVPTDQEKEGWGTLESNDHRWSDIDTDGKVILPKIVVPPKAVENGMARFEYSSNSAVGARAQKSSAITRENPRPFLLDVHEVTNQQFSPTSNTLSAQDAVTKNWFDALSYAERVGKRLPYASEYQAAATNFGRQLYPWGNDSSAIADWSLGPVNSANYDQTMTSPPVFGLYSNVAEWTSTWGANPAERVVCGAPWSVINGNLNQADEWKKGPRAEIFVDARDPTKPGIGFRCCRSVKPHLTRVDFAADGW